ncbi:MAG: DUF2207 domain-containing protein [Actinobacteria bacterium]|nr:DUF2207 domain-containing protein [Actinomycetota bacterium]
MRAAARAICLAATVVGVAALAVPPAGAQSFHLASVEVEALLAYQGDMRVVESITYDFDGSFSSGERPIPPGPYGLTDFQVTDEDGDRLPISGAPHNLQWEFDAEDERRTFEIAYTVTDVLRTGSDVADLRWQWLGPQHPGVDRFRARLRVPGDGSDVLAWGRGPLSREVDLDGPVVTWQAEKVPPGIPIDGRVAIPILAVGLPAGPAPILPGIVADERAAADEANRRRSILKFETTDPVRLGRINRWFVLIPLVGWMTFGLLWREWGAEPEGRRDVGRHVREPPPDPPALVPPLLSYGALDGAALAATIVDLAQRGALQITEERGDRDVGGAVEWRFDSGRHPGGLRPFEQKTLQKLFENGSTSTFSGLAAWTQQNPAVARRWWSDFADLVNDEFRSRGYVESGPAFPVVLNLGVAMVVLALSISALVLGAIAGIVGIVSALAQFGATLWVGRRSPRGTRRATEWKAFRRFLLDFSNMRSAPSGHLGLWERYLVYSVALGISEDVSKGIAMKIPVEQQSSFAGWYRTVGPGGIARFGVYAASFRSAMSAAFGSAG